MATTGPLADPPPVDAVEQYLDLIGPEWRARSVVLPPSDLPLDEIQPADLAAALDLPLR